MAIATVLIALRTIEWGTKRSEQLKIAKQNQKELGIAGAMRMKARLVLSSLSLVSFGFGLLFQLHDTRS